jgi:cell division protein FtsB
VSRTTKFLLLIFGGILLFSWLYLPSLTKYRDLKLKQEELDKQIEKLTEQITEIREERDLLKNDVEYLEKVIRDEMGLVKPGEIVYKFVQDAPGGVNLAKPTPENASTASGAPPLSGSEAASKNS